MPQEGDLFVHDISEDLHVSVALPVQLYQTSRSRSTICHQWHLE